MVKLIKSPKVAVIMPGHNVERTLSKTVSEIDRSVVDEIILVDDGSDDQTSSLGQKLGLTVIRHPINRGYGAAQKTGYHQALAQGAEIIVMVHPDYQYDPKLVSHFVDYLAADYFDVMLGSRIRSRREVLAGGMPLYKYIFNRLLTLIENIITGQNLSDWHTGYRAYQAKVLKQINYQTFSDDFVFDSQMLFAVITQGFRVGELPVPVRYFKEASSLNFSKSLRYGLGTVSTMISYLFRTIFHGH